MKEHFISAYIDNELDLDEKIEFIEIVHADRVFKMNAVQFLVQEKRLRSDALIAVPFPELPSLKKPKPGRWRLLSSFGAAAGLATAALLLFLWFPREPALRPHRFVIFQPDARRVELAGTFSEWRKIPLTHAANSGYWEITLELPQGDHRFSYIIEGSRRVADPTIGVKETDDFGGENSILALGQNT
jgi:hypothetical protein